jgi:mRNA interferase MazF
MTISRLWRRHLSARWMKRRTLRVPERGEVWQVDFGITQKVRPALVISIPYGDADRALIDVIPHTTAMRGSQFEVSVATRFLEAGAFLVQGIQALPPTKNKTVHFTFKFKTEIQNFTRNSCGEASLVKCSQSKPAFAE